MESMSGRPWQILVIDDDEEDYLIISRMLQEIWQDCVNVHWHAEPEGVEEKVCSNQFEASIIDSHLYGKTGIEIIEQIMTSCPHANVLMISAWPDRRLREEAIRKGAASFIDKNDLTPEYLTTEIKRVISS